MLLANYHVHSDYCDGKNTLEEMVVAGIAAGLTSMGLASHLPLPFANDWTMKAENLDSYLQAVRHLKNKYAKEIELYCGLEIDYFIDRQDISELGKQILPELDYVIMSVHTMGNTRGNVVNYIDESPTDFDLGIAKYYHGNPRTFIEAYYQGIAELAEKFEPDILGHIDLIKKYNQDNRFFNEQEAWYQEAVKHCLDRIAQTKTRMEINTGANLRIPGVGRYPSDWMIPEMRKRNIPITFGGDSHTVDGITFEYDEAEAFIKKCGYKEYWILKRGRWEAQPLGV